MFAWRHLYIVFLLLMLGCTANADDNTADCGKVLGGPIHGDTIYVLCPSLSELSESQAYGVVEAVLDQTSRTAGETRIIFLSDPTVFDRDWQYQNMEKRLESWGDAFVGTYHTNSGLLTVRSSSDDEWRNVRLEIP